MSSTGFNRAKISGLAPTIVSSVPSHASLGVRPSGASTKCTPCGASSDASASVELGSEVEQSTTIAPGRSPFASPVSPRTIASTSREPVTQRNTMVERAAISAAVFTSTAPRPLRSSTASRLLRPITVSA